MHTLKRKNGAAEGIIIKTAERSIISKTAACIPPEQQHYLNSCGIHVPKPHLPSGQI